MAGPVTVLSPKPVKGPFNLSAEIKTARPGPGKKDTLQMVFNYLNMHQYYYVCLQRDGVLGLWKRTGEWSADLLASARLDRIRPQGWNRIDISWANAAITVRLNEKPVLSATDPNPYEDGRFGFDAPVHVAEAGVRGVGQPS